MGRVDNPSVIQQKLGAVSEKERKVLQELFKLTQEIEIAEAEEKAIAKELETLHTEISSFDVRIKAEEDSYAKKQEGLKQVMKTYQRMGAGSFLEIIMDSDSLTTFLRRVNILRDFTRKTGELLEQIEESKNKLALEKKNLNEKLLLVEKKQQEASESLAKKLSLKKEQEDYLTSLKGEREFYKHQLLALKEEMNDIKAFLASTTDKFSKIVEAGSFPQETLKIDISFSGIKGIIEDKALNEAIQTQADFPKIVFAIHPEKTEMSFPDKNLRVSGNFIIDDGHILKFIAEEGSILGMTMETEYVKELFSSGEFTMDLEALLQGNTLETIAAKEGYIELSIKFNLFR
jgi:peptidoglycan hydrolase CwlO-like protein